MKIIQTCPICGTEHESKHEFDSLEDFYGFQADEPEFDHDARNTDCGGSVTYCLAA